MRMTVDAEDGIYALFRILLWSSGVVLKEVGCMLRRR